MTDERLPRNGTVDRLYALDGGEAVAPDRSQYSQDAGKHEPIALCCNAYLMKRAGGWILWDTGIQDDLVNTSEGKIVANNIRGIVTRPLVKQLGEIGISPADIETVILSHAHFDHIGNCGLFPHATWYIQELEYAAMFGPNYRQYGYIPSLFEALRHGKVELLSGDYDLFADGSILVFATPGHTPGHCSLLVHLAKTGPVMLSGDVAHFKYNLEHRLVPTMNSDYEQSRNSMERVKEIVRSEGAQLWLNHDIAQNSVIRHAPAWFD